jgi:hypothetical protein
MPYFYLKTFRALTMIVASFGRYLPLSGHDHETGRVNFLAFCDNGTSQAAIWMPA